MITALIFLSLLNLTDSFGDLMSRWPAHELRKGRIVAITTALALESRNSCGLLTEARRRWWHCVKVFALYVVVASLIGIFSNSFICVIDLGSQRNVVSGSHTCRRRSTSHYFPEVSLIDSLDASLLLMSCFNFYSSFRWLLQVCFHRKFKTALTMYQQLVL